jgi:hypothetical protein
MNLDFGEPKQNGSDYPMSLTEKYQPRRIEDFIGLEGPKRLFANLLKAPRPVAVLLVGPPGCGKTTLGLAFADELPGTLHHISSQKCDVASLDRLSDSCQYWPARGRFHVVLVDEADQMTERAQASAPVAARRDRQPHAEVWRRVGAWRRPAGHLDLHLQRARRERNHSTGRVRAKIPEPLPGGRLREAGSGRDRAVRAPHLVARGRGRIG